MPPIHSIGFHYSKWESNTSAARILDYNEKFEVAKIPVDVFWMDIPHTDGNRYFTFNRWTFSEKDLENMKHTID